MKGFFEALAASTAGDKLTRHARRAIRAAFAGFEDHAALRRQLHTAFAATSADAWPSAGALTGCGESAASPAG